MNNVYDFTKHTKKIASKAPKGSSVGVLWTYGRMPMAKARKECIFKNLAFLCVNTWRTLREINYKKLKINIVRTLISYNFINQLNKY